MSDEKQTESQIIDIDAFVPRSKRSIQFDGKTYPVVEVVDLSNNDALKIETLDRDLKAATSSREEYETLVSVIQKLVPSLPREVLDAAPMGKVTFLVAKLIASFRGDGPLADQPSGTN